MLLHGDYLNRYPGNKLHKLGACLLFTIWLLHWTMYHVSIVIAIEVCLSSLFTG